MSSAGDRRVVIVGGNIGGLALALGLRRVGIDAVVLERAPGPIDVQGGLHIWTNGTRALARLGVDAEVRAAGEAVERVQFRATDGRLLMDIGVGEYARRWGNGAFFVPRRDLPRVLREAVGDGAVRYKARCVAVAQDAEGATATLEDGTEVRGSVLVGADGGSSVVRTHVGGPKELRSAGYQDWGAVIQFEQKAMPHGEFWTLWGPGLRFGIAHIGAGRMYWAASIPRQESVKEPPRIDDLLQRFRGWAAPVEAAIAATPPDAFFGAAIRDLPPMRRWGNGRVTLLGDAAHATTPNLGRGASEALEDGVVLAARLSRVGDLADRAAVDEALRDYERARMGPTAWVTNMSSQIGRLGRWQNPLAVFARSLYIRAVAAPTAMKMRQDFQSAQPELTPRGVLSPAAHP